MIKDLLNKLTGVTEGVVMKLKLSPEAALIGFVGGLIVGAILW